MARSYWLNEDMSAVCWWLMLHGYTCHVKLNGSVELRKKPTFARPVGIQND